MPSLNVTHRLILVITFISGLFIALWGHSTSQTLEKERTAREFGRLAQARALRMQSQLDNSFETLKAYQALFLASERVSREEYKVFSSVVLASRPEIFAMHWCPRVLHSQRKGYEREMARLGLAPLGIFDVTKDAGHAKSAPVRKEYFPVFYAEPLLPNKKAVGLDPLARPYTAQTLTNAARLGRQVASPAFPVVQDPEGPLAVAVYQPIYNSDFQLQTDQQRLSSLTGYVIMMIKPAFLITTGIEPKSSSIELRVVEKDQVIYPRNSSAQPVYNVPKDLIQVFDLNVPGRKWQLHAWPTSEYLMLGSRWQSYYPLLTLLIITFIVVLYLYRIFLHANGLTKANDFLQENQKLLDTLAYYDPLTKLPNRSLLERRLTDVMKICNNDGLCYWLCAIDLDAFKPVNDKYGHKAGDWVLQQVALRLNAQIYSNELAARLGGDEFILIISDRAGRLSINEFFQQVVNRLADPIHLPEEDTMVMVSASMGVVQLTNGNFLSVNDAMHEADVAMYQAKSAGKNCFHLATR